jgi:hypothetical protein
VNAEVFARGFEEGFNLIVRTAEDVTVKKKIMMTGIMLENPEGFVREIHRKMGGRTVQLDC